MAERRVARECGVTQRGAYGGGEGTERCSSRRRHRRARPTTHFYCVTPPSPRPSAVAMADAAVTEAKARLNDCMRALGLSEAQAAAVLRPSATSPARAALARAKSRTLLGRVLGGKANVNLMVGMEGRGGAGLIWGNYPGHQHHPGGAMTDLNPMGAAPRDSSIAPGVRRNFAAITGTPLDRLDASHGLECDRDKPSAGGETPCTPLLWDIVPYRVAGEGAVHGATHFTPRPPTSYRTEMRNAINTFARTASVAAAVGSVYVSAGKTVHDNLSAALSEGLLDDNGDVLETTFIRLRDISGVLSPLCGLQTLAMQADMRLAVARANPYVAGVAPGDYVWVWLLPMIHWTYPAIAAVTHSLSRAVAALAQAQNHTAVTALKRMLLFDLPYPGGGVNIYLGAPGRLLALNDWGRAGEHVTSIMPRGGHCSRAPLLHVTAASSSPSSPPLQATLPTSPRPSCCGGSSAS